MGCNYYAIPKATDSLKLEIIEKVVKNNFKAAKNLMPCEIHIGKSSAGWQFLFNHNNWEYFERNKSSLYKFLKKSDIIDEYGRIISYEDFITIIRNKQNEKFNDFETEYFGFNFCTSTEFS